MSFRSLLFANRPTLLSNMWSWGRNDAGQLGLGDTANRSSPVQVGTTGSLNWLSITCSGWDGKQTIAVKTDGTLWSWGYNNYGQLGLGDIIARSSSVQVGALTNWLSVAGGRYHSLAIKTDGTLWAWGNHSLGQLGIGAPTGISKSSPVQVGALTTWSKVTTGSNHSLAVKTDGTLWSWGQNAQGQLGLGYISSLVPTPTQVGTLTWSSITVGIFSSLAIKTDGTLWSWGMNLNGCLGLGTTTLYYSSPTQVGALTNWLKISINYWHSLAIKTDGTLWSWGRNDAGQLGLGDTVNRSSPVQVGALTNWLQVVAGAMHTVAVKTDGTLWSWGRNDFGQLGLGNLTNYSSPVQIGVSTWSSVAGGNYYTIAIK